jgi:hypothetical protein
MYCTPEYALVVGTGNFRASLGGCYFYAAQLLYIAAVCTRVLYGMNAGPGNFRAACKICPCCKQLQLLVERSTIEGYRR